MVSSEAVRHTHATAGARLIGGNWEGGGGSFFANSYSPLPLPLVPIVWRTLRSLKCPSPPPYSLLGIFIPELCCAAAYSQNYPITDFGHSIQASLVHQPPLHHNCHNSLHLTHWLYSKFRFRSLELARVIQW